MQESRASFGRRPVIQQVEGRPPGAEPRLRTDELWIGLAIVAIVAAALFLARGLDPRRGPIVSAADAAAIEQVIAGQGMPISALAGIPNVSVDFYDIEATDAVAIRRELDAKGPVDRDGQRFDADTQWYYRWHWDGMPDGSCGTPQAEVSFRATIRLPHLARFEALKPDVAQAWRSYMTALAFHEAGHVANGYAGRDSVASAVRSSSCETANAAGQEAIERLGEGDRLYDRRTRHGAEDGATFG